MRKAGGTPALQIPTATPAVLEEYRREFDNFRQAVAAACRRVRAGMVDAYSAWPMEDVVPSLVSAGVLRVKRG